MSKRKTNDTAESNISLALAALKAARAEARAARLEKRAGRG